MLGSWKMKLFLDTLKCWKFSLLGTKTLNKLTRKIGTQLSVILHYKKQFPATSSSLKVLTLKTPQHKINGHELVETTKNKKYLTATPILSLAS